MTSSLGALLQADPAFASGATSFSSGLETLVADGFVTDADTLTRFLTDSVALRWNTFDRVVLVRSHALGLDTPRSDDARLALDRETEITTPGERARSASRRAGIGLLGTWARLGSLAAARYRDLARSTTGCGHLAVAQGLVHAEQGVSLADSEAVACWALLSGQASSAVRLGVVGHRAAQTALLEARRLVEPLLAHPVAADAVPHAFTPVTDIALERHSLAELKLFAS
ncbi:hypothetical protein N1031_04510 [Herbiconiux moechotypicola]|uniref:Urease accessory UreF family protein n=1 Tax=Herbiconiux moechotypicola TaxID=637393 RepID=A0ABN3D9X2_9MICO|nr:urease accessory UreF family protein [Herbiconiux moechotypicola]MCS5729013.1 hypothetical protein [Herbiconiux moechotypicola]